VDGTAVGTALTIGSAHIVARYASFPRVAGVLKPIPIAILAALVVAGPSSLGNDYRRLVVAALVFSMIGDVCLVFPGRFTQGLASFLVAHLLYLTAFAPAGAWSGVAWLGLVPFAVGAGAMLRVLWPHLGRKRAPVAAYVTVIAVMAWRAAVRATAPEVPPPSGVLAAAGALVFMVSDGVLSVNRFARRFGAAEAIIMSTYYAAQTLLALSARV
jgi:uncharacterized membrane protein YhhN